MSAPEIDYTDPDYRFRELAAVGYVMSPKGGEIRVGVHASDHGPRVDVRRYETAESAARKDARRRRGWEAGRTRKGSDRRTPKDAYQGPTAEGFRLEPETAEELLRLIGEAVETATRLELEGGAA